MADADPHKASNAARKKGRCPRCGKHFQFESVAKHKTFPFCSERCRDVDLGNWMSGNYAIPGEPLPPPSADDPDAT
jgi:uncharacterized protein